LDETQLNASASIPGTFEYSAATGEVLSPGKHKLSVTFLPTDSGNYATAQASVALNVREKPLIDWPHPAPIPYGTLLSELQLCASSVVPGVLEYKPGLGALLGAGEHPLSVNFTPADAVGYSPTRAAVSLMVEKATPDIAWPKPDPIVSGEAVGATQLNATARIPGDFAYSPAAGQMLAPGEHALSVTFTPADTVNYTIADAVVPLTVVEKFPSMVDWARPSAISYGTALSATQLNAEASVAGTFAYTPAEGHVLAPGTYTLSVSFTPSDKRYTSAKAEVVLEVKPDDTTLLRMPTHVAPAIPALAEANGKGTTAGAKPRETRLYKGAVYEKGEDGQWHLQRK
jgi:hypothetical protein